MAGSINKVTLIGNVCADPEIRSFNNGGKVANFSLATNETWKDKNSGERKEKAEFHRIAIFQEGLVGVVERYVKKGSKIYIEGKLATRKWTDRDGNEKYTTEVVLQGYGGNLTLLDSREGGNNQNASQRGSNDGYDRNERSNTNDYGQAPKQDFELDSDIPF